MKWFHAYCETLDEGVVRDHAQGFVFTCPCCGYPTLEERGGFEVCVMCEWEDDGQDSQNADMVLGGPNSDYSLAEARRNFEQHFTCYRPSDTSALDGRRRRIEWARATAPKLEELRRRGRVELTRTLIWILRTEPGRAHPLLALPTEEPTKQ